MFSGTASAAAAVSAGSAGFFGVMTDVPAGTVGTLIGIEEVGSLDAWNLFHLLDS